MPNEEQSFGCYGVVVSERKFHASPLCPALRTVLKGKKGEMNSYPREADAIMMGHIKRCPVCFNMNRFRVKVNDKVYEYLLTNRELEVLKTIAAIHRVPERITTTGVAERCGLMYEQAKKSIRVLKGYKLIAGVDYVFGIQVRGKRRFTATGVAVIAAYEAKCYGVPLSEEFPASGANNKLI